MIFYKMKFVYDVITLQIYELSSSNQQAASNESILTKSRVFLPYIDM